jgi:hypothetical protein
MTIIYLFVVEIENSLKYFLYLNNKPRRKNMNSKHLNLVDYLSIKKRLQILYYSHNLCIILCCHIIIYTIKYKINKLLKMHSIVICVIHYKIIYLILGFKVRLIFLI